MRQRSEREGSRRPCLVLTIHACLLLAAGGVHAWSQTGSAPAAAAPAPDRAAAAAPAPAPAPAIDDKSLPDERYVALGLPAYDRDWSPSDVTVAAERLTALAASHPEQLPRFESGKSGKTFARIATSVDASFFRRKSLSLAVRLSSALEHMQATNSLFELYLSALAAKQVAGADLTELFGAQLRNCVVVFELIDEFLATLPKDDPNYAERMAGLDEMRSGLAEVVTGALSALTEEEGYSVGVRLKLLGYCRETFPSMVPRLTAASQAEVRQRLDALVADPKLRELQPQLRLLREAIGAAPKA